MDVTNVKTLELQQEVLELRRRVKKLTALLRLVLAPLRSSGFTLTHERLPDRRDKTRILRAADRARDFVPLRPLLRFLRLSPSRFHAWRRLQDACALDDRVRFTSSVMPRFRTRESLHQVDRVAGPDRRSIPPPLAMSAAAASNAAPGVDDVRCSDQRKYEGLGGDGRD
jgi:hypothetical protein